MESGIEGFDIDLSMGTHFFNNIVSFRIPFLTAPFKDSQSFVDWDWLQQKSSQQKSSPGNYQYIKHIKLENPLLLMVDGRKSRGIVALP